MADKLYIHLPQDLSQPITWIVQLDANSQNLVLESGQLKDLPSTKAGTKIIVLVPTAQTYLTKTQLPKVPYRKLLQATPYAVEEELAQDISTQHFSLGERGDDQNMTVAVVKRQQMDNWLAFLNSHDVAPDEMTPDVFALPFEDETWHCYVSEQTTLIRLDRQSGISVDTDNLEFMLNNMLEETIISRPTRIILHKLKEKIPTVALKDETIKVKIVNDTDPLLIQAAKYSDRLAVNLLQGDYKNKRRGEIQLRYWRTAGILAGAWIVLLIALQLIQFFQLRKENTDLQNNIATLFKQAFPGSTKVVDPREAIQGKLNRLITNAKGSPFLRALGKAGSVWHEATDVTITEMSFNNNKLILEAQSKNFENLEKFQQKLRQTGLNSQETNVRSEGKLAKTTFTIDAPNGQSSGANQ